MSKLINETGNKYSRLLVLKRLQKNKFKQTMWLCRCDCGKEIVVSANSLRTKKTKSCGCLMIETIKKTNKTHGMSNTNTYHIWEGIIARCNNKKNSLYKNINVSSEWKSFENFYNDMGKRPSLNHSIDRINNNGNYEKNNCRWADKKEQAENRRSTRFITHNGETKCIKDWSKKCGLKYETLLYRINSGWNIKKAITYNLRKKRLNSPQQTHN